LRAYLSKKKLNAKSCLRTLRKCFTWGEDPTDARDNLKKPAEPHIESETTRQSAHNHQKRSLTASLVVLALGWVMIYADRLSISPLMNTIRDEFGLSYAAVSLVLSAYFVTYILFTIPATFAAEKAGYRKIMSFFMLLAAVGLGLAGLLGFSYLTLILFIAIHGIGAGAYYPTAYTTSTNMIPKHERGFSSAVINSGMGFGSILGLIVAGPLLSIFADWHTVLEILALPTAAVALMLYLLIPPSSEKPVSETRLQGFGLHHYRRVMRNRDFLAVSLAMFCSLYGYWVILSWGPTLLQETRHLSIFYSGLVTAVFAAVAIPSSILISRHSDKAGRFRVAIVTLPLAAATIFVMAYSRNLIEFLLAIASYGVVGKLTLDPVAIAWVGDVVQPELRGASLSVLNVVAMSSSIAAPIITGVLADVSGTLIYGFYFGVIIVAMGPIFLLFSRTRP
jgi:MFS family permease